MRRRFLCLLLLLAATAVAAEESPVDISYVATKDLRLYYYNYLSYLAPHAVRAFTNSRAWERRVFDFVPSEPATVLLEDFADYGNAYAYAAPRGMLVFEVSPPSRAFETNPASERMYSLMNHELIHVMQSDISSEEDQRWRSFFLGKVPASGRDPETLLYSYLTIPRFTAPSWYAEGGAVFFETWMAGGLGRAQGGYDEMVFRAMVRDDAHFYDPLGLASRGTKVDFQTAVNSYLYGTRFFTYLAYTYSPEKLVAWIRRDEGSERYYSDQFEKVFGLPLEKAWQDWIAFEHEFQRRNLAEVRKFPITPQRKLVDTALGSVSRMYYDEATATLYGAFRHQGVVEHVGALNTHDGTIRPLADVKSGTHYRVTSFAYDSARGTAFFTNNNLAYRDLMAVDVKTGEERLLLKHARIGEMVVNPVDHSLIGVRVNDGLATLVRIPYPYTDWTEVHTFPYEYVPTDLDISPDGKYLSASVSEVTTDQFVRVWELDKLLAGDVKPLSEFRFGQSVPESFVFSKDGRYLYGSSYYTGVSNIYRYEVTTGKVDAVSNSETGFFRPIPLADGRLVVLTYTGEGFVPAIIEPKVLEDLSAITFLGSEVAEKYPVVKTWQVPAPNTVDEKKLITDEGPYLPLRSIRLANAYPVVQGYKNTAAFGYQFNFEDPLKYAFLGITAAYSPDNNLPSDQRGHIDIVGRYEFWNAELAWNRSDFYDLFGPTKVSRKGYAAKLGYEYPLIYDLPQKLEAKINFAYYDQIDTLPNAQNIETNFTRLVTGQAGLFYTDVRRSVGAIDDEKGLIWKLVYQGNRVNGQVTPQLFGNIDLGTQLPIPHSSLWSRTYAGVANGDYNPTVANFYFGGFGNNYVDDGTIQRYREYYSMPGFGLQQISALKFVKETAEWMVPPIVFEDVGTPSFFLTWLRPSVFAMGLWTEPTSSTLRQNYASFGAQGDLRFTVLHRYDMTLSVGFGAGFQGTQRSGTEWMVSLKIM